VGIDPEIFDRLTAWIANQPDRTDAGWVFPSETVTTPLRPGSVLERIIYPRLEPLGLDWINFAVLRRSHSNRTKKREPIRKSLPISRGTDWEFIFPTTLSRLLPASGRRYGRYGRISRRCNPRLRFLIETNETKAIW
jgi:hypothetical protein